MGIIDRIKAAFRSLTVEQYYEGNYVGARSTAGPVVGQDNARGISAYWCGRNVISGDIGVLDRHLYKRVGEDDRERATSHPVAKVLHEPNRQTIAKVFYQTLVDHALSWGNGYAEIEWDNAMRPLAMWTITPDLIEPKVETTTINGRKHSTLYYLYRGSQRIPAEDIIHIPGPGFDGIRGYSVVQMARQSLGLTIAAEQFGASFYGEGAWPGLALSHPANLSVDAQKRLADSIQGRHQGAEKAHRLIVLEEGMQISKPLTIPPNDAQFLETRAFQVEEMARWLNIPTWKLKANMDARAGGNPEASEIEYHVGTLLPWTTTIEQELNRKLISSAQRNTYYIEHLFDRRLKANTPERMESYKTLHSLGVLTATKIARMENLPKPEEKAKDLALPEKIEALGQLIRAGFEPGGSLTALGLPSIPHLGLIPVTVQDEEAAKPALPEPPPVDAEVVSDSRTVQQEQAIREMERDRVEQYVRRESGRVRQASKRDAAQFGNWAEEYYRKDAAVLSEVLKPVVARAMAGSGGDVAAVTSGIVTAYVERSKDELLSLPIKDLSFAAERLATRWEKARATELMTEIEAIAAKENRNAA